jgi:hypothetical protein
MVYDPEVVSQRNADNVLAILTKFGPLNFESIKFFLFKELEVKLSVPEISLTISGKLKGVCAIDPDLSVVFVIGDSRDCAYPMHQDYVAAFFDLLERYNFVKSFSDFKDVPESWVSDLYNADPNS